MSMDGYVLLDNIWMASDFDGTFTQLVKVPKSEVFEVECDCCDAELATIPCAYGTAENMVQRCQSKARNHVLVTGASVGVGSAVVQLVKRRGAMVTAVAGQAKMKALYAVGVDNVAGEGFSQLLKVLKRSGRYREKFRYLEIQVYPALPAGSA